MAIGDIADFGVVVPDAVGFQFREELFRALLVEMLDAAPTAGCDDLEPFGVALEQPGYKRTSAAFEVAQNLHFVRKPFLGLRSPKRLVHPTVVTDANHGSQGVLDLVHIVKNMAHKGAQASSEEAPRGTIERFLGFFADRCRKGSQLQRFSRSHLRPRPGSWQPVEPSQSLRWRDGTVPAYVSDTPQGGKGQKKSTVCGKSRRIPLKNRHQPKTIWRSTNWNTSGSTAMSR